MPTFPISFDGITAESMLSQQSDTLPTQYYPIVRTNLSGHHDQVTHHIPDVDTLDESAYCQQVSPNNISYLNISCESDLDYSIPLYGYFSPFLLLTTVVANTLIILVLSKRTMKSPTNLVLMAMAFCDMLTLIFPSPGLIYMYTFGNHYKPLTPISACHAWYVLNEVLPAMFHTASIWLTVALAAQRYIYVCHAPLARTWCTMPKVKTCIVSICVAAVLHQSTKFFDKNFEPVFVLINNANTTLCHLQNAPWVDEYVGLDTYFSVYFIFRVLFVHLLPCVILVILNAHLFRAMRQAQDRRKILFSENHKKESKKQREANYTTLMLIVVVTVFLLVEIPLAVITALHIISAVIVEILDYRLANRCILFANFALMVSYPINFAIYCGMSRQFRETFKDIVGTKFGGKRSTAAESSRYSQINGARTCTNETVL